ncbi:NAD-dependent epimerase/dehydratase family protein [Mesorhizobium sp. M2E.F.Ca.ET.166.01.1.1]|nr:NAD-dependent epimerase/dehydratase family protein [Mesorhizobium sp. M2E.F.Ca.ET.166.01.1.1]TGV99423.1 NAD-dependent epimerase/dehydratase family protein [Mesorhizobium sp. M2E.F.Ca.ET.154.01.1.1]
MLGPEPGLLSLQQPRRIVANPRSCDEEVGRADAVFHLASPIGVQLAHRERFAVTSGILDSGCAIVEACRFHRRPLLYTSSSEVYGSGRDRPITEADPVITDLRPRWGMHRPRQQSSILSPDCFSISAYRPGSCDHSTWPGRGNDRQRAWSCRSSLTLPAW